MSGGGAKMGLQASGLSAMANDMREGREQQDRLWNDAPRIRRDPTVQMSVRMSEQTYARFRQLCEEERRKNGEMLEVMMKHYMKVRKPMED